MAKTTTELRQEIAQTRHEMTRTIEALSSRVEETRRRLSLTEHVRQRPLLIAAGVAVTSLLLGLLRGRRHF